jgi:tRNA(Arg) A34 adenosine deaminase TadA
MCASAIRWAGFREYVYGTSINGLVQMGWPEILIPSDYVVEKSWRLATPVSVAGSIGTIFTDPLFAWQFQESFPCPDGCIREDLSGGKSTCRVN